VRAAYPGASPETLDAEVTRVIESAAARVPGVYLVRSSSEEGTLRVIIEFRPDTNLVDAANDVRDAVARISGQLPDGVQNLSIVKADADAEPVMQLAVSSRRLPIDQLTRAIEDQLEPELVSVPGVAEVTTFGDRGQVMRVRLDPSRLSALGLSVDDVASALRTARADVPAGNLPSSALEVLVRADASLSTPAQVAALRLRVGTVPVRISDVADVYLDPADAEAYVRLDGRTVVSLGIVAQAQSNSVSISDGVRTVVDRLNADNPDLQITVVSDDAAFIRMSIREVLLSLLLSVVIVVAVVGVFLGRWRQTLVPAVAIPVALVGTLGAIWLLGFSINIITLLALVLASGLVVDDAIVVLENIQRRRNQGLGARAAAVLGTREVFFAVVATTATLVAVFLPIAFLPSQTGRLFTEFGFVMAIAVALSSFVALSMGPMLASRLPPDGEPGPVQRWLAAIGAPLVRGYESLLAQCLRFGWLVLGLCVLLAAAAVLGARSLPQELAPSEDRGEIIVWLSGPEGTGLPYTDKQLELALQALQPLVDEGVLSQMFTITGRWDPNRAEIVAPLKDWAERGYTQAQVGERVQRALADLPGVRARVRGGSSVGGGGSDGSISMAITGDRHESIAQAAYRFAAAIETDMPGLRDVRVDWEAAQPQLGLTIDRQRASELGVTVDGLDAVLRAMVDGFEVTDLSAGDRTLPVILQSSRRGATDPADLLNLSVRAASGALVPMSQFVKLEETAVSSQLDRFGQRRSVGMSAQLAEGVTMQQAVDGLRALSVTALPPDMGMLFRGDAATLQEGNQAMLLTFAIALTVVFLVLVAQFESPTSAAVVMLTVPFGLSAAVFAMLLGGVSLNIYSQIGLLLLVGVMAKNSILMVEFADQLRDAGRSVREAAQEAAATRLRPIMMTMASTVLGALPLVLASGAGAEARVAIGTVIFGGLSLAALFTLFLTPVIYLGLARFSKPRASHAAKLEQEMQAMRAVPRAEGAD